MASLDLRDAYLHIPIQPESRKYLRLAIKKPRAKFFLFSAMLLPFRLASAPLISTMVLTGALQVLRSGDSNHPLSRFSSVIRRL